jgi:Flp pilus assembly pilin Flp
MSESRFPIVGVMLLVTVTAVTMLIMPSRQAVAQGPNQGPLPVEIAKPLPVAISGNVGISGTPTINFSNSSSTPLFARYVDPPTAQPFNYYANLTWAPGFAFANADAAQNF